jgi:hypothetical protein
MQLDSRPGGGAPLTSRSTGGVQKGAPLTSRSLGGVQKRGSNFGRVDALRWWLKLRHDGAPACPGACFQVQKSKRKPDERDMRDSLQVCRLAHGPSASQAVMLLPSTQRSLWSIAQPGE